MKSKILITGLGTGGAERFLEKILPLNDVEVISITNLDSIGKLLEKKGVKVTYLNKGKVNIFKTCFKLFKELKKTDHLMTFLIHADLLGRFIGRVAGVRKITCNIRNDYSKISKLWILDKMTRFLVSDYIVNSPSLSSYMKKIRVKKYKVIPNGVDIKALEKERINKLNYEGKIITCVARLEKQKDHKTLIEAMKYLKGYTLLLIGEGKEKENLEKLAEGLNVKFLGNRKDVASILKQSDVFVLPSLTEGMSNALLEAMALSLPCVVSNIEQNKVVIKNNINGLTFKVGDEKDLAEKIKLVKKDHGKKAKETIIKDYDIKNIRKVYEGLL